MVQGERSMAGTLLWSMVALHSARFPKKKRERERERFKIEVVKL